MQPMSMDEAHLMCAVLDFEQIRYEPVYDFALIMKESGGKVNPAHTFAVRIKGPWPKNEDGPLLWSFWQVIDFITNNGLRRI